MNLAFPYHVDRQGKTATADRDGHIRDLIEQVLFTSPGERVMHPDFGSGLASLVFEPNSGALATTTQMLVQGALQQHLGHLIAIQSVAVSNEDSALRVEVEYSVLSDQSTQSAVFVQPGSNV
jgi:Bacteriophage baseplate protein W